MLCFLLDKLNICSIIRIGESVRGGSRLQEGGGTGMKKVYVRVTSDFDATGYMQPKSIVWTNGKIFPIESIRDFRPAESVGNFRSDCYTVVVGGQERHLFFEKVDPLFTGRIGRWYVEVPS